MAEGLSAILPIDQLGDSMAVDWKINFHEQCDEVLSIRSMYEGFDEELITILSEPDEDGQGLFRILLKVPVVTSSDTIQVDLMMPVIDWPSQANEKTSVRNTEVNGALDNCSDNTHSDRATESLTAKMECVEDLTMTDQARMDLHSALGSPNLLTEEAVGDVIAEKSEKDLARCAKASASAASRGRLPAEAAVNGGVQAEDKAAEVGSAAAPTSPPYFGSGVALQRTLSGQRWSGSITVRYLTPLALQLTLPPSYPSADPPAFVLSCAWLRDSQLSALCKRLDQIWESTLAMPVIYTWAYFLENETLSFLGLNSNIVLMPDVESEFEDVDDRALSECQDLGQAVHSLLQYSRHKEEVEFCKSIQTCGLCFDEKIGSKFYRLDPCKHHFCYDCLFTHCNMHVQDGTVHLITCPGYECKSAIHPGTLRNLLSPQAFQRWETLCLQKTLDEMDDVVYCPRCQSVVIRDQEAALNLGHCLICYFSFCTACSLPWHQGTKCKTELEYLDEQGRHVQANDKRALERFRELQRQAVLNAASVAAINTKTVKCPRCKIPIEKFEGCNKMTCRCGAHFCWVCGVGISGYDHFRAGGCQVFNPQVVQQERIIHHRRVPDALLWMQAQAETEGANGPMDKTHCIQCKQVNYKLQRNNHIKCWNCKVNMCFYCKSRIEGVITRHFHAAAGCPQHS